MAIPRNQVLPELGHCWEIRPVRTCSRLCSTVGPTQHLNSPGRPTGPANPAMHDARTCYDHLAGRLAVNMATALVARGYLVEAEKEFTASKEGGRWLATFGVAVTRRGERWIADELGAPQNLRNVHGSVRSPIASFS